jgi:hypothetical protein
VQREILEARPTADLRVYAVWVPFLAGSRASANIAQRVLPDRRVIQFWDAAALTSDWFAKNVDHTSGPSWDAYYLYGPDARWKGTPEPLISSGETILGQSSRLERDVDSSLATTEGA